MHRRQAWICFQDEARERVLNGLRFLWKNLPKHRGFFFHWANINTGERMWQAEVSSIDTAILFCGMLTCREHFRTPKSAISLRHFQSRGLEWLSEDTLILPHGWTPENGFSISLGQLQRNDDDVFARSGFPTHPLPPDTWNAWKRTILNTTELNISVPSRRFSFISIPKPGSISAANATNTPTIFKTRWSPRRYTGDSAWTIEAVSGLHRRTLGHHRFRFRDGYEIWGGPPATGPIDGTVVPCATGGLCHFCLRPRCA